MGYVVVYDTVSSDPRQNDGSIPLHTAIEADVAQLPRILLLRLYEKGSSASQSPQHEATHGSVHERFATRTEPLIVLAHILRLWQIQAKERSTTQRRGNTTKPFGGISRSQSTTVPSFSHCSAHAMSPSLGAGFFGRSTRSTLHPNTLSTHSLPLSSLLGSRHRPTGEKGGESAHRLAAVAS